MIELYIMDEIESKYRQVRNIRFLTNDFGKGEFVLVAGRQERGENSNWFYSALIPLDDVDEHQTDMSWLNWEGDRPALLEHGYGEHKRYTYERFGYHLDDYECFAYKRMFIRDADVYYELNQEFVLFFNLYYDELKKQYVRKLNSGEDEVVAIFDDNDRRLGVKIKLSYLVRYAAAKQMAVMLVSNMRCVQPYRKEVEDLEEIKSFEIVDDSLRYLHLARVNKSYGYVYSEIRAKKIIMPPPIEQAILDFSEKNYGEFIVNVDGMGNPVYHTCNPKKLKGVAEKAKSVMPDYETVVYFKKDVLDKYYRKPDIFVIHRGGLSCGDLWGLKIWPYGKQHYAAYLEEIGKYLPQAEHSHWMRHNVLRPSDELGAHGDETLAFDFIEYYREVKSTWMKHCGWSPFCDLVRQDETKINTIRIPMPDDEVSFNEVLLTITLLLVDYLNENEIKKHIMRYPEHEEIRGINKLKLLMEEKCPGEFGEHIKFLHSLYKLRSKYTAHRKSSNISNEERDFGVGAGGYENATICILKNAVYFLLSLLTARYRFASVR